jgi:hypothetical protein
VSLSAPLRVPVELRAGARARWFRLAHEVSLDGLELGTPAPEELDGTLEIAFHLPGDAAPVRCRARARGETLRFLDLDEAAGARIDRYLAERLGAAWTR